MLAVAQWLIHIFSSVCCLLPCASVVVFLAFDVMLIYAKRVPVPVLALKEVLHTYIYNCTYMYNCDPITAVVRRASLSSALNCC